jgi:hypothetical protein
LLERGEQGGAKGIPTTLQQRMRLASFSLRSTAGLRKGLARAI